MTSVLIAWALPLARGHVSLASGVFCYGRGDLVPEILPQLANQPFVRAIFVGGQLVAILIESPTYCMQQPTWVHHHCGPDYLDELLVGQRELPKSLDTALVNQPIAEMLCEALGQRSLGVSRVLVAELWDPLFEPFCYSAFLSRRRAIPRQEVNAADTDETGGKGSGLIQ